MQRGDDMARSIWLLAVFGLVWNGVFGVADHVLVSVREPTYLAIKAAILNIPTVELVRYYDVWPEWVRVAWVMNVWSGLAGSVLLVLRDRFSAWFFAVSIVGLVILSYFFYLAPIPRVAGDPWGEWLEMIRTAAVLTSLIHSCVVIVAVHRLMPVAATR